MQTESDVTTRPARSVPVEATSTRPADRGRAMAVALDQLIQEIIADTDTGTDPRRDPNGLHVSLHVNALPTCEAITVLWRG